MANPCPFEAAITRPLDLSPMEIEVSDIGTFRALHVPEAPRYAAIRVPSSKRWQVYDLAKRELGCQLSGEREMRIWMIDAARSVLKDRAARPSRRARLKELKSERKARAIAKAEAAARAPAQMALF
jgi:hypothetical protein